MKIFLMFLMLIPAAHSAELKFDNMDQLKLAEMIKLLPEEIRNSEIIPVGDSSNGIKVISQIGEDEAWSIRCEGLYYHPSPYASRASCQVEIDEHHFRVKRSYDEVKISLTDMLLIESLYKVIPGGPGRREFRSWGRENGTTFSGKSGQIFHYFLSCSPESCDLKLSTKALKL